MFVLNQNADRGPGGCGFLSTGRGLVGHADVGAGDARPGAATFGTESAFRLLVRTPGREMGDSQSPPGEMAAAASLNPETPAGGRSRTTP